MNLLRSVIYGFLTLILISSANVSCNKDEADDDLEKYTIEGTLYQNCDGKPLSGVYLELGGQKQIEIGGDLILVAAEPLANTFTDSYGHFLIRYRAREVVVDLSILSTNAPWGRYIGQLPLNTNVTGLELHQEAERTILIHLDVKNPYTEFDTLVYKNEFFNRIRVLGPFQSGFLFSRKIRNSWHTYPIEKESEGYQIRTRDTVMYLSEKYELSPCGEDFRVDLVIE